jgi:hypothetical protein
VLKVVDGDVAGVKYGAHAYDQWSVDELLDLAAVSIGVQGGNSSAEWLESRPSAWYRH